MFDVSKISTKNRILTAVFIGVVAIAAARYASIKTNSDVMFAEMFHSIADVLGLIFYLLAILTVKKSIGKTIGKISGMILFWAGLAAFFKVLMTLIFSEHVSEIKDVWVLVSTSLVIMFCIWVQMLLTKDEHGEIHGHQHNEEKHVHHAHTAVDTELQADMLQSLAGLGLGLVMFITPEAQSMIRSFDVLLTIILGFWMCTRGLKIVFG